MFRRIASKYSKPSSQKATNQKPHSTTFLTTRGAGICKGFPIEVAGMAGKKKSAMAGKKMASTKAASTSGLKRTRAETAAGDDEDAFEVGPSRARSQQAAPTSDVAAEEPGEIMEQCRICPRVLVKAVKGLNIQQIQAVQVLGFDSLFHLQVETVPPRLLAWCLDKFDPVSCSIEVPDHAPLHISAEDVYMMFGFPRGPLQIESVARTKDKALVQEWTTMFEHGSVG